MTTPSRSPLSGTATLALMLAVAVLLGYATGALWGGPSHVAATEPAAPTPAPSPAAPHGAVPPGSVPPAEGRALPADELAVVDLFERCSRSVAYISRLNAVRTWNGRALQPSGTGTGFVWDKDGHIVTNVHVVDGADQLMVTLSDRSTWRVKHGLTYKDKDVAVLTIDAPADVLHPVEVGSSKDLLVGQTVYAIGNPFGLDFTLSHGIVSALGREIDGYGGRPILGVIQTDAAINPGNSGGPLLDSAGRLVGMNTMIYSTSGSNAGIGFAVPVDDIRRVVEQLVRDGKITRPGLGVNIGTDQEIRRLRLPGVPIHTVTEGSAAERAGLRGDARAPDGTFLPGDIVVQVGDQPTPDTDHLRYALESYEVGATVTLTVRRGDETRQIDVTLQAIE